MSLRYIIDGYNLLNHKLFPAKFKKSSEAMVSIKNLILLGKNLSKKSEVIVVFDGFPSLNQKMLNHQVRPRFVYSGGKSADQKIKEIVENSSNPKEIIVVTDDKEIRFTVKAKGAQVLSVEEFIFPKDSSLGQKEKKSLESSKPELSYQKMYQINRELRKYWLKES